MTQLGRPSEIYRTLREGRCGVCAAWIRLGALRAHYEVRHPHVLARQEDVAIREIPLAQRIPELIEAGVPMIAAAAACGIPERTFMRWMEWGSAQEEQAGPEATAEEITANRRIFWQFQQAVHLAREAGKAHLLRPIADDLDWRSKAWMLERMHPSQFGRVDRLRVGGDADAGPVRVIHEEDDPNFVEDVMRIYREQGVTPGVDSAHNGDGRNGKTRRPKKEA